MFLKVTLKVLSEFPAFSNDLQLSPRSGLEKAHYCHSTAGPRGHWHLHLCLHSYQVNKKMSCRTGKVLGKLSHTEEVKTGETHKNIP